jgi:hypothetical protein
MRVDNRTRGLAALVGFVLVGGCATTTDNQVGQTPLAEPSTDRETHSSQSTDPDGEDPSGGNDLQDGLMPEVVCMNLQDAQNAIQEHGVFRSRSVDATGADRMQIRDRNWVVVDQSPFPGVAIGEGDAVLDVVKTDETSQCTSAPPTSGTATTLASRASAPPNTTVALMTTLPPATVPTTSSPTTTRPPPRPTTTIAILTLLPQQDCDPNYSGACVPIASDVDCAGGSGNGPAYVQGPVHVVGADIYDLDGNDNDGIGCES